VDAAIVWTLPLQIEGTPMIAFCPQCKRKVTVVAVSANDIARKELAGGKPIQVVHVSSTGDHVWMAAKGDLAGADDIGRK
jgi:hypothetical protein